MYFQQPLRSKTADSAADGNPSGPPARAPPRRNRATSAHSSVSCASGSLVDEVAREPEILPAAGILVAVELLAPEAAVLAAETDAAQLVGRCRPERSRSGRAAARSCFRARCPRSACRTPPPPRNRHPRRDRRATARRRDSRRSCLRSPRPSSPNKARSRRSWSRG